MNKPRPNLVFVRVGKNSLHRNWLDPSTQRRWDLQLSQYDDDPDIGQGGDLELSVDKGTKWDSIYRYLIANPELLDRYKYIMFMDDDLLITTHALNRFFEICEQHDLMVAQPSIHISGYSNFPVLTQLPGIQLRYATFIECMAPAIRTDYLKAFLPHLKRTVTGWGIDHVWTMIMDNPAYKSAIIDEISMVHTRPHTATSKVYKDFAKMGITPKAEMRKFLTPYQGLPRGMFIYGGLSSDGRHLSDVVINRRNGRYLIANTMKLKSRYRSFRSGVGMILRSFTNRGYLPEQLETGSSGLAT